LGSTLCEPSRVTVAPDATVWSGPAAASGDAWDGPPAVGDQTSISARPTFCVPFSTDVTVSRTPVVVRRAKLTVSEEPSFGSGPKATAEPSLNVSVPD